MKRYGLLPLYAVLLFVMCVSPAMTKAATLTEIFSGNAIPLAIKYKDITPEWKQFSVNMEAQSTISTLMMLSMASQSNADDLPKPVYLSKGETLVCGAETYLIAYQQADLDPMKFLMAKMRDDEDEDEDEDRETAAEPVVPAVTEETELSLCLLNLKRTGNLLQIRPFDFKQVVAEQASSLRTLSQSNLKQLATALQMYAQDNDETLPKIKTAEDIAAALDVSSRILRQPASNQPYLPNPALAGLALGDIADPGETPVFYEPTPAEDGSRSVAFLDGHVAPVSPAEWEALQKKWGLK